MTAITDNAVNFMPRKDQILDSLRITQLLQAPLITAPGWFAGSTNPAGAPLSINAAGDITLTSTNNDVTAITLSAPAGGFTLNIGSGAGSMIENFVVTAAGTVAGAISLTATNSTSPLAIELTCGNAAGGIALTAGSSGKITSTASGTTFTLGPKQTGLTVTDSGAVAGGPAIPSIFTVIHTSTAGIPAGGRSTTPCTLAVTGLLATSVIIPSITAYSGLSTANSCPVPLITSISSGTFSFQLGNAGSSATPAGSTTSITFVVYI